MAGRIDSVVSALDCVLMLKKASLDYSKLRANRDRTQYAAAYGEL
jgi:hypothetical protein